MQIRYWRPEPMRAFLDKPLRLSDENKLIRQRG